MGEPMKAVAINAGFTMDAPDIRALFQRAYADSDFDVDATAMCDFLRTELDNPNEWLKLFVAWGEESGFVGVALLVMTVDPIAPYPWVSQLYAEAQGARAILMDAVTGYFRSKGFSRFFLYNTSGASDRAYKRLFENDGLKGHVKGSLIVGEL